MYSLRSIVLGSVIALTLLIPGCAAGLDRELAWSETDNCPPDPSTFGVAAWGSVAMLLHAKRLAK